LNQAARRAVLASASTLAALSAAWAEPRPSPSFLARPYLQFGDQPQLRSPESMMVMWETPASAAESERWSAAWAPAAGSLSKAARWQAASTHRALREGLGVPAFWAWSARLNQLKPGQRYVYRLLRDHQVVWESSFTARKPLGRSQRFVLLGDSACGSPEQRAIAHLAARQRPDYAVLTGDLVYPYGQLRDYRAKLFDVFNADTSSPQQGAPLMRSVPFAVVPGNHDLGTRSFPQIRNPELAGDVLAYFYEWLLPLNGPCKAPGDPNAPRLEGSASSHHAFLRAAGARYPRMASYSLDYGDVHWTMLDSNDYVNPTLPAMQRWIEHDIRQARAARWHLVAFHHPPFHSSSQHAGDQQMRLLAPLFERLGVDVVFAGHVHTYERSKPLRFAPASAAAGDGAISGRFTYDQHFDGVHSTQAHGVIYITSGAGGARLYDPDLDARRADWKPYTETLLTHRHSLTLCEVSPQRLQLRQLSIDGQQVDTLTITHAPPHTQRAPCGTAAHLTKVTSAP
jgi:acid phosphatase type 7